MSVNMSSVVQSEVKINYQSLRKLELLVRAINHRLRQEIIKVLQSEGEITVTDLYIMLRTEQSVTSQHLALLRKASILITSRKGKYVYYSVDKNRLKEISRLLDELVK